MIQNSNSFRRLIFVTSILAMSTGNALAYLDPGTGSMVIQALAAGAISVGIFWRGIVTKAKMIFGRSSSREESDAASKSNE